MLTDSYMIAHLSWQQVVLTVLFSDRRDRPSAAECLSHPWLWQQLYLNPEPVPARPVRERSCGAKWAAHLEDPEDKENFLDSSHSHAKRFRLEEEAPGDGDV